MTARKRNPVPGVVVYKQGNKWAYRVELERDPLTNARQWEYQSGFATEDEAWTAGIKAKSDHKHGRRVAPNKRTVADFLAEWMAAIQESIVAIQPESGPSLRTPRLPADVSWVRSSAGARGGGGGPPRGYGGAVAGGSQGPSVNSRVRASRVSMPHLAAVDR